MAESNTHFKIKKGQIEIEFEGPANEVSKRYDKAFDWVSSLKIDNDLDSDIDEKEANGNKKIEDKKSNRGGRNKAIYPKFILKAKAEGFFKAKKTIDEVMKKFGDYGAPISGKKTEIKNSLKYDMRKPNSKLHATKENGVWTYWED